MRLGRRRKGDSKELPGWLVSFTDMITLLLSFFILLQVFAKVRDPELFLRGQGGFRRAIEGLGIPDWLYGQRESVPREFTLQKHPVEEDPTNLDRRRIIDAEDEKIRRLFEDLRRLQRMQASNHDGPPARLLATPITFDPGDTRLRETARAYLADFASDIRVGASAAPIVYVIGLAPDADDPAIQWQWSAGRAAAVQACLEQHLAQQPPNRRARVDSWGAGPAGPGLDALRSGPRQTFIVLAMMESPNKER
ncbi:MAG: hypothetical protein ISS74_00320 [Planctomycetes bacterium]|nr:hypothetical protein [Planctomycetota bacterium]